MSGMKMSFWFGTSVDEFLFPGYKITTVVGLLMTCLAVMLFAFLFEVLKLTVQKLAVKQRSKMKIVMHTRACPNDCHSLQGAKREKPTRYGQLLQQVLLYTTQNILANLLMLAVMTYNGYFTLSVVLGGGLGYLVFGPGFMKLQLQNALLRKNCPGCKDQCGVLQQSEGNTTTLSERGPKLNAALGEDREQEHDETDQILETCHC